MLESGEMYIETIFVLKNRKDKVHAIDVATELGYAKSSVSRALNILNGKQMITIDHNGEIDFNEQGRVLAQEIYERHEILTKFLLSIGLPEDIAENDACRIEHVISPETVKAIKQTLKN